MTPAQLVANAKAVILDFDGPMCDVFAALPANKVASELMAQLPALGLSALSPDPEDPLAILSAVHQVAPEHASSLEAVLSQREAEALVSAPATPGIGVVLEELANRGTQVAVASNNGLLAIDWWLEHVGWRSLVASVVGRSPSSIGRMKPDPDYIARAALAVGVSEGACVFVGDSVSDAQASAAAAVPFIGFINKESKRALLTPLAQGGTITSVLQLI